MSIVDAAHVVDAIWCHRTAWGRAAMKGRSMVPRKQIVATCALLQAYIAPQYEILAVERQSSNAVVLIFLAIDQ